MRAIQLKQRRSNTRELVLDTALQAFTDRGYFNTSVQDVARVSGVSIGSIYHHFKDKEGIARALYERELDWMSDAIEAIVIRHGTAREQCRAIVVLLFALTEQRPSAMEFMLYAKHREFLPGERPVCSSRPFELMRKIVVAGIEAGEIRPVDPFVASTAVFGGAMRMIAARLDGIIELPLDQVLEQVWSCAWRSIEA